MYAALWGRLSNYYRHVVKGGKKVTMLGNLYIRRTDHVGTGVEEMG